jgi:hypothetical protein
MIFVIIGEHKVQAIAEVAIAIIFLNMGLGGELYIDSITTVQGFIPYNTNILTAPEVNGIARIILSLGIGRNLIILNGAIFSLEENHPEAYLFHHIIFYEEVFCFIQMDRGLFFGGFEGDIEDTEALDGYVIGTYLQYRAFELPVNDWSVLSDEG